MCYYKFSPDSDSEKKFENWSIFNEVKRHTCEHFDHKYLRKVLATLCINAKLIRKHRQKSPENSWKQCMCAKLSTGWPQKWHMIKMFTNYSQ